MKNSPLFKGVRDIHSNLFNLKIFRPLDMLGNYPDRIVGGIFAYFGFSGFPRPKTAIFEVTNACNLDCPMCDRRGMSRDIGYMDLELYKDIFDRLEHFVENVRLYSTGEPLLHPDIFEMIKYARSRGKYVNLSTNATLLDEGMREKLLEKPPSNLKYSVEGGTPERYERYRKGADFENVYENIKDFYKMREDKGKNAPYIKIHPLITKKTNIKEFVKLWGKWVDEINVGIMRKTPSTPDYLQEELYETGKGYTGCSRPFKTVHITHGGKVSACCGDFNLDLLMGDLTEENFDNIWNSDEYNELRKNLIKGKLEPPCNECPAVMETAQEEQDRAQTKADKVMRHIDGGY